MGRNYDTCLIWLFVVSPAWWNMNRYQHIAATILQSRHMVALTGAGISVESGIPDFRSEKGLWAKYDPMEFGHIDSFRANPQKVWQMLLEMDTLLSSASPNPAHYALAELEKRGILKAVITQNVDSLHQRAGSRYVIEFHGNGRTLRCDTCSKSFLRENVSLERLPPVCSCGGPLRPDYVFFGEGIPSEAYRKAMSEATGCDFMLVVGTSASVAPASLLPYMAKDNGAFILQVNPGVTELSYGTSDMQIFAPAGEALPAILSALDQSGFSSRKLK